MASTRRLAAILAADVVGYSRLMGADEEGTLERLKAHRRQLIDPKIAERHGRIVKTSGDGLLAEFPSVVDAVRCAAEVQRGMLDREPELSDERRIRLRIGINLGDVIADGDDIFGDGVNVAARLEALAEPGGISVSGMVYDQIRDKLPYRFADRGEQSLKNIARPVRVYALRLEDRSASRDGLATPRHRVTGITTGLAAIVAPVFAVGARWLWPATKPLPTPAVTAASSIAQPLMAPRLSIVVLPFANLSNDPEQQYFADGITEDVTTDLSRIANSFVISRNTAFTYRDKRVDTKQIGRELGVRYVLEGSVRRSANKVRVNAQLIDAETDAHLWAEQFDGDISDLFAVQNEITSRIAIELNVELSRREAARPSERPEALDFILRGRAAYWKGPNRDQSTETLGLYERALALDPHSVEAQSQVANLLAVRAGRGWSEYPAADFHRAEELLGKALTAAPNDWLAHYAKGAVLRWQGRCEEAIPEYERALLLNPNWLNSLDQLAWCKLMTGTIEDAIPLVEQAIRLSPRDPYTANFYGRIGQVHLLQSRLVEAIHWLEQARSANPDGYFFHGYLASAYALNGESERAAVELAEARRLASDDRYSSIARVQAAGTIGGPGYWGCQKSLPCSKPPISPACARPGCPRNNALDPPSCRDPRRRCGGLFAADGGGRGGDARTPQGPSPAADRPEDRRASRPHRQNHRRRIAGRVRQRRRRGALRRRSAARHARPRARFAR
jgi:TolB-like protein/class 3 adenylate cyclase/Flp pilus assembly protein TadD